MIDLATARETFEDSADLTVGIEEEFALVDPESLLQDFGQFGYSLSFSTNNKYSFIFKPDIPCGPVRIFFCCFTNRF